MSEKYRVVTAFYFRDHDKNSFTDTIDAVVVENNPDGSFKKIFCYCTSEDDAALIVDALNKYEESNAE